ncbi:MAG: hypothetical protein DI601_00105 [Azospirillum brasilense]|nr:MAG: hypothetical protein DI601_00105 [Azospirillum brasilense]
MPIEFLPRNHPIQSIGMSDALIKAQRSVIDREFATAGDFFDRVLQDLRISGHVPADLRDQNVRFFSDMQMNDLVEYWGTYLTGIGIERDVVHNLSRAAAERSQLLRAFDDPTAMLEWTISKVAEIVADLPSEASHIQVGRNPGDVLDPYILAATQNLLCGGDNQRAIEATVAHKALMVLEGLLGHLHEEVLGRMRGNVRAPEPRGELASRIDADTNPFPGADVVTPPLAQGDPIRFHQVKSKTGSMNSSGGHRLALQLVSLREAYPGSELYSHSLVGTTLAGHRTMGVIHGVDPSIICTVGKTAFRILTGSDSGPELLLRVYQSAFKLGAERAAYDIETASARIVAAFEAEAAEAGEGFLESILHRATDGPAAQQSSLTYVGARAARLAARAALLVGDPPFVQPRRRR